MRCPGFLCTSHFNHVVRKIDRSIFIRRIRECDICGLRFETEERKKGVPYKYKPRKKRKVDTNSDFGGN